jgi:hypothetical protein
MKYALGWILFVFVLVVIGPFLTIWALNTLFPVLAIPYGFWTWAAVVILGAMLRFNISYNE